MAVCDERDVAVQTIKSLARAPWDDHAQTRTTWYEPLEEQPDIDLAVHWVLGCSAVFLNTVGDVDVLPRVLDAAERFQTRPGDVEMQQLASSRDMVPLFT
jgi:hypothetical protein